MPSKKRQRTAVPRTARRQDSSRAVWAVPVEVWMIICQDLDLRTLYALARTSKHLWQMLSTLVYVSLCECCKYERGNASAIQHCLSNLKLLRTLATRIHAFGRVRLIDFELNSPPPKKSEDRKTAAIEADELFAAARSRYITDLSLVLPKAVASLASSKSNLDALRLSGDLLDAVLARSVKGVRGFPNLKLLHFQCISLNLDSLIDVFEFISRCSLKKLYFQSGKITVFNRFKRHAHERLIPFLSDCIAALPEASPELEHFDLHLDFVATHFEVLFVLDSVVKAIEGLVFPSILCMHAHFATPWGANNFEPLIRTHTELRGQSVEATWPSHGCKRPPYALPLSD